MFFIQVAVYVAGAIFLFASSGSTDWKFYFLTYLAVGAVFTLVSLYWWLQPLATCVKCNLDEGQQGWGFIMLTVVMATYFFIDSRRS